MIGNVMIDENGIICGFSGFTSTLDDEVNHPSHYNNGQIECIDAIKAALTDEEFRGFCKGNVLKHTWRERHKGGDESLKKAAWYLEQLGGDNG